MATVRVTSIGSTRSSDLYWCLVLIYAVFQLVSDVTAGKFIHLASIEVSASVLYFPATYIVSDILTEVYGYERARRALWIVLGASVLAGSIYQIVLWLPNGPNFHANHEYQTVLGTVPRVLLAGWIAVFTGETSNNYVLSRLKILTKGQYLWIRTIGSTLVGQTINSVIFFTGAFYGSLPEKALVHSIFWAAAFKVAIEVFFTPLTCFVIRVIKAQERIDFFDVKTNYSPFKFL